MSDLSMSLFYEGNKQNQFLYTSLQDQISLDQIDNQELQTQCIINFITPFENVNKPFIIKIDGQEIKVEMQGSYEDIYSFCTTFIKFLNKDGEIYQIDQNVLLKSNKIQFSRQDQKEISFQCDNYWLCKIFGCVQNKLYQGKNILFEKRMYMNICRTLNVICLNIMEPNYLQQGQPKFILIKTPYSFSLGNNVQIVSQKDSFFTFSQLQKGLSLSFQDENFVELELEGEPYQVELVCNQSKRQLRNAQEYQQSIQQQKAESQKIQDLRKAQYQQLYNKIDEQYQEFFQKDCDDFKNSKQFKKDIEKNYIDINNQVRMLQQIAQEVIQDSFEVGNDFIKIRRNKLALIQQYKSIEKFIQERKQKVFNIKEKMKQEDNLYQKVETQQLKTYIEQMTDNLFKNITSWRKQKQEYDDNYEYVDNEIKELKEKVVYEVERKINYEQGNEQLNEYYGKLINAFKTNDLKEYDIQLKNIKQYKLNQNQQNYEQLIKYQQNKASLLKQSQQDQGTQSDVENQLNTVQFLQQIAYPQEALQSMDQSYQSQIDRIDQENQEENQIIADEQWQRAQQEEQYEKDIEELEFTMNQENDQENQDQEYLHQKELEELEYQQNKNQQEYIDLTDYLGGMYLPDEYIQENVKEIQEDLTTEDKINDEIQKQSEEQNSRLKVYQDLLNLNAFYQIKNKNKQQKSIQPDQQLNKYVVSRIKENKLPLDLKTIETQIENEKQLLKENLEQTAQYLLMLNYLKKNRKLKVEDLTIQ